MKVWNSCILCPLAAVKKIPWDLPWKLAHVVFLWWSYCDILSPMSTLRPCYLANTETMQQKLQHWQMQSDRPGGKLDEQQRAKAAATMCPCHTRHSPTQRKALTSRQRLASWSSCLLVWLQRVSHRIHHPTIIEIENEGWCMLFCTCMRAGSILKSSLAEFASHRPFWSKTSAEARQE